MRVFRMTTRRWMLAVGFLGVLLGCGTLAFRLVGERERRLKVAGLNRELEAWARLMIKHKTSLTNSYVRDAEDESLVKNHAVYRAQAVRHRAAAAGAAARADYFAAMKRKYERAASRPWVPLGPDPPPPPMP